MDPIDLMQLNNSVLHSIGHLRRFGDLKCILATKNTHLKPVVTSVKRICCAKGKLSS